MACAWGTFDSIDIGNTVFRARLIGLDATDRLCQVHLYLYTAHLPRLTGLGADPATFDDDRHQRIDSRPATNQKPDEFRVSVAAGKMQRRRSAYRPRVYVGRRRRLVGARQTATDDGRRRPRTTRMKQCGCHLDVADAGHDMQRRLFVGQRSRVCLKRHVT